MTSPVTPATRYYNITTQQFEEQTGQMGEANVALFAWSSTLLQNVALSVDGSGNLNVTGGGGGGSTLSDTQVQNAAGTWTAVGYATGNLFMPVLTQPSLRSPLAGSASSSGDNTIITPAAGKRVRMYYLSIGSDANNINAVTFALRIGASAVMYQHSLVPGAIFARNIGADNEYAWSGTANDSIILNLSNASLVNWNIEHDEI